MTTDKIAALEAAITELEYKKTWAPFVGDEPQKMTVVLEAARAHLEQLKAGDVQ